MTVKRIDFSLFDEELKALINSTAKVFPVQYDYVATGTNPNNYDYVRCLDVAHKNEIYVWDNGWSLIGADDLNVSWVDVKDKPVAYNPTAHTHLIGDVSELQYVLDNKAPLIHSHPHTHVITDVTDLQTALDGKSATTHDHDGRYYTESEVNTYLGQKAPLSHTHTKSQITDFPATVVTSVATRSGDVVLTSSDVGLGNVTNESKATMFTSPAFTGTPTAPTAVVSTNNTQIATTAFVKAQGYLITAPVTSVASKTGAVTLTASDVGLGNVTNESKATMFTSPVFTGTPTAPTPITSDDSTNIATTAYVQAQGYTGAPTKAEIEAVLTGVISSHSHATGTPTAHASTHITGGTDVIPAFTSTASGLAPLSGGGTTKYLRADGTWQVPPDTIYTHPTSDGYLHVPATSTTNNGKVLRAGSTAGSISWYTLTASDVGASATGHTHVKANITDFPTNVSSFTNDAGYIKKAITVGTVQPIDSTMWYKTL